MVWPFSCCRGKLRGSRGQKVSEFVLDVGIFGGSGWRCDRTPYVW